MYRPVTKESSEAERGFANGPFRLDSVTMEQQNREATYQYERLPTLFSCNPPCWQAERQDIGSGLFGYDKLADWPKASMTG